MKINGREIDYALLKDGGVVYGDDPPTPGDEGEEFSPVGAESPGINDVKTKSKRRSNDVETKSKRRSNDVETALKPCSNDVDTASKPSPTLMALFSQWLLTVNKDKLREEYDDKQKFCKELADGKLIKRLTFGVYTLETLPMNKQKELCDYAEQEYGFDWNKVKDLVMITRIFTRVPKKNVVLMNLAWATALFLVVWAAWPKAEIKARPPRTTATALVGEERKADSTYIRNWADSKKIYLYDCRYGNLLKSDFHQAGDAERIRMMEAEYEAQLEAVKNSAKTKSK